MTETIPTELLELAEYAIETKEFADIDCTADRELLAQARSGKPVIYTAAKVKKQSGITFLVGMHDTANHAYKDRVKNWTELGFKAHTRRAHGAYCVYAEWPS